MADLSKIDKLKLEKYFDMSSGYVLDFSNRTFAEFILESAGIDIYENRYGQNSGSKANRLRAFWHLESNYTVGKLIIDLLERIETNAMLNDHDIEGGNFRLHEECKRIGLRLKQDSPVENIEAIKPNVYDRDFDTLAKSIKQSINDNEPESALDRLHTFVVRYMRELCKKHSIAFDQETTLHSLFGSYVKYLTENNLIDSKMTTRILKSTISVMDAFNDVRNNRSFAHDNPILNYNESILILNDISNVIKFIETLEETTNEVPPDYDLPF